MKGKEKVKVCEGCTLNKTEPSKKVHQDSTAEDLVLPNNKLNSNTKTKTQRAVGRETKKPPSPNEDTVRAKRGLALSKFKFGKKRGPCLISITVIRVPSPLADVPLTPPVPSPTGRTIGD